MIRRVCLSILLLSFWVGVRAELVAPAELVVFPVEPGRAYHVEIVLENPEPGCVAELRFYNGKDEAVEPVELALGRASSSRQSKVSAKGVAEFDAVAGNGPGIEAGKGKVVLLSGKAAKLLRWKASRAQETAEEHSGGIRPTESGDMTRFARNLIVNPGFEEGDGTELPGWRYVGPGSPRIVSETFSGKRALLLTPAEEGGRWETTTPVPLEGRDPLWVGYWTKFNRFATLRGQFDSLRAEFLQVDSAGNERVIPYLGFHMFHYGAYDRYYGSWFFASALPYQIPEGATHVRFFIEHRDIREREDGTSHGNFGNIFIDNAAAFQAPTPELPISRTYPYERFLALRPEGKLLPFLLPGRRCANTVYLGAEITADGNLFFAGKGKPNQLSARVGNLLPTARDITVSGKVTDSRGAGYGTVSAKVHLAPYELQDAALPLPAGLPFGAYTIECVAAESGEASGGANLRFVLLEHPSRVGAEEKRSEQYPFDLHPSTLFFLDRGIPDTERLSGETRIMKLLGVRAIRIQVRYMMMDVANRDAALADAARKVVLWREYFQPCLDQGELSAYFSLMEQSKGNIVRIPSSPEEWSVWRDYHTELVKGLALYADFVLFGNEGLGGYTANIPEDANLSRASAFPGTTREWFSLYREAYRGAKAGAPEKPFGPAHASDVGGQIAKRFLASAESGGEFDCWGVNAYQDSVAICGNVFRVLAPVLKKGQFGVVPEVGFAPPSSGPGRLSGEQAQAENVPQVYLRILGRVPFFSRISFFIFSYHNYGIFDVDRMPRPAAAAYAVMTDRLGAGRVESMYQVPGGGEFYIWRRIDGSAIGVGWSASQQTVALETDAPGLTGDDLFGNHRKLTVKNGICQIKLTKEPVYVLGAKRLAISRQLECGARFAMRGDQAGVLISLTGTATEKRSVTIRAESGSPVRIAPLEQVVGLLPGGRAEAFFQVTSFENDDRSPVSIRFVATQDDGLSAETVFSHPFLACVRAPEKMKLDGRWEQWREAVTLHADKYGQVELLNDKNRWNGPADLSARIFTMYDEHNFYFGARVRDDSFAKSSRPDRLFEFDAFELGFVPDGGVSGEFLQFTLGDSAGGPVLYQHLPVAKAGKKELPPDSLRIHRDEATGTTEYQVAIPWKLLDDFKPEPGRELGFGVILDDSDGKSPADRKFIHWYGSGIHYRRIADFGRLILGGRTNFNRNPVNLVKNSSFGEGMKGWGKRVRIAKNGMVPEVKFYLADTGCDDGFSAGINSITGNGSQTIAEYFQDMPVQSGREYMVSVRCKQLRGGSWQMAYAEHRDKMGTQLDFTPLKLLPEDAALPPMEWRRFVGRFKTRPDQTRVTLSLRLQHLGSGEVLYDDAQLYLLE